jgi:F-type H+-transporting ATPase subunit b
MAKFLLACAIVIVVLPCGLAWAAEAAGAEAETSGGLFSGTFGDALWTVIAFVALLAVLGKVAWRPLLNGLNARQSHIEQQLKSAEDSRQRAEHMLEDYKQQGLTVLREATEQAQRHQQDVAEKTRQEVTAIRRRAQEEIESARSEAEAELWRQAGEIALRVGSEVLGRALSEQDNQRLMDEAINRIRQSGGAS